MIVEKRNVLDYLKLARAYSWWNYLVPFFSGILYLLIYIFKIEFEKALVYTGLFLINIIGTASFGYLLNDITDREDDKKAGKKNQSGLHSSFFNLAILAFFLILALSAGYLLPKFYQNIILYFTLILLFLLYSVYPVRLKRFAVTGVVIDSLYNCTFMTLVIITTVYLSSNTRIAIGNSVWFLIVLWTFMKGARGIFLHQLMDRSFDRRSGVQTFVIRFGAGRSLKILTRIIVPVEIICTTFLVILLSRFIPGLYFVLISFFIYFIFKLKTRNPRNVIFRRFGFKLFFAMNDFYEVWIPLSALAYLSVLNPNFLILLGFHCLFFYKGIIKTLNDILSTIRNLYFHFRSYVNSGGFWFFYPVVFPFHHLYNHIGGAIREKSYRKIWKYLHLKMQKVLNNIRFSFRKSSRWLPVSSISRELFESYNMSRSRGALKFLCNAPFSNLYFSSDGKITSCCYNREHLLGIYPDVDPLSAWNGKENKALRKAISNIDLGMGCFQCRSWIESRNFDAAGARFYDKYSAKSRYPVSLEFELSNNCNLKCIMCNEKYSSQFGDERTKLTQNAMKYDDHFIQYLEEFIPHLKEAKFLGGEPFFIEIYYRIWEKIIELNPGCIIDVQTNATILNERVRELLSKGNFQIGVSIDSLQKEEFEKIRKGANFSAVQKNIEYFKNYCRERGTLFHISFCPIRSNWKEIPEMIEFSNRLNAFLYFNTVLEPKKLALWSLPLTELNEIISYLENFQLKSHGFISERNKKHFNSFLDQLRSWYKASCSREKEWMNVAHMDFETVKNNFLSKIHEQLRARIHSWSESSQDPDIIIHKVSGILNRFPESTPLKMGLLEMERLYLQTVSDEMIQRSEEELYSRMASYIKAVEINEDPLNFDIFSSFHQRTASI